MPAGPSKAGNAVPRWNLGFFYTGPEDPGYIRDKNRLKRRIRKLERILARPFPNPENFLVSYIEAYNKSADLYESLYSFVYMTYTTDTRNASAARELGVLETIGIPLRKAEVIFRTTLSGLPQRTETIRGNPLLQDCRFYLREQLFLQNKQMAPDLEELAADLSRSGGDAWERMHAAISAGIRMPWNRREYKTIVELRALASSPDRAVREKAYGLELEGWKNASIPLSFALNGVKGFSLSLNDRRGWKDTLERSIRQSRISRKTFDALLGVMTDSLPLFRRYYRAKARLLGLPRPAFYDLFAPVGRRTGIWTYTGAADFIVEKFSRFSPEFGDFARRAFAQGWVDAEVRDGKIGGAYCIDIPVRGESRIFCNFDGTFSSVTTLAHELGHAYHQDVLKTESAVNRTCPMTLAETASIFSETIVMEDSLRTASAEELPGIMDSFLQDAGQVIVDILSRFLFEKEVFERRRGGDLSVEELCELMLEAQKNTYGDALDGDLLHPWMWAVKGHYYRQDLGFYNFPYAFGLLFSLGLFSRYEKEGPAFAGEYRGILAATGRNSAEQTAKHAGADITRREFWQTGIDRIARYIERFEGLQKQ